jgi:hypothetical protein
MSFQTSALILSWFAILLLALVVSGLVRQVHALSTDAPRRPGPIGLRPGAPAPGLDRLAPEHPDTLVLLFLSSDCRTCAAVLDEAVRNAIGDGPAIRALYAGPVPSGMSDLLVAVHGEQADLFERYDAIVTPFAVVIDRGGRVIRSAPLGSAAALRTLLEQAAGPLADGTLLPGGQANHLGGRP